MRIWAAAYHQQFPDVTISTAATGSGAGIADASAGTADIGTSDAYISSGNLVKNPALVNIPLAISAQQVDYNLPGLGAGGHVKLSGAVLARMYEGTITAWNDPAIAALNPGVRLPAIKVVPVHRSDSSGDTFLFSSYLSTQDPAWNSSIGYGTTVAWPPVGGALARRGNNGVAAGCEAVSGCVAYVGISYLSQALAGGLGEAELANAAGRFVLPTAATIGASVASRGQAGAQVTAAERDAAGWYAANEQVYRLDLAAAYAAETKLVIGTGPVSSAAGYTQLESDISRAIAGDLGTFHSSATAGASAFGPLEDVVIVSALLMAGGSAWGLGRRLGEYR